MFNQTFVDGTQKTRKPYTVALSLLLQVAVICLLVLLPLLYTQVLPGAQLRSLLIAPPPPAPLPKTIPSVAAKPTVITRTFQFAKLIAPTRVPDRINNITEVPAVPDLGGTTSGSDDAGSNSSLLYGNGPAANAPAPPPAMPTKPKAPSGPLRVGGNVAAANMIHRVEPIYPPLAKSARVQGSVEFTAIISKDGRVENLQLVRGHPLLVSAAREAILQWQYRPTMLNGEPVEVSTVITVNFMLAQ